MKKILGTLHNWLWAIGGLLFYAVTRKTLPRSWQAVVILFCRTGGKSSDFFHKIISQLNPTKEVANPEGILGNLKTEDVNNIVSKIREDGFYVPPVRLSAEVCDELLKFALETEYYWLDDRAGHSLKYERGNPKAIKYQVAEEKLINHPAVQKIMSDLSLYSVAQRYLNCAPTMDLVGMWWTTDFSKEPSARAATMYHFDMTRIAWLNVFINLTDVNTETGPHSFVRGSHKTGGIPQEFLSRGYVRIPDNEVESFYPKEDLVEFNAPRGTIIIEDTRGLHKGKHVLKGDRLLFQISFVDSLFGGVMSGAKIKEVKIPQFKQVMESYPRIYSQYIS